MTYIPRSKREVYEKIKQIAKQKGMAHLEKDLDMKTDFQYTILNPDHKEIIGYLLREGIIYSPREGYVKPTEENPEPFPPEKLSRSERGYPNLPDWFPDWLYDQITPEEAKEYFHLIYWSGLGPDQIKQVPNRVYHVSPNANAIMRTGFKTAKELDARSFGGHGTYVSVTTLDNARVFLNAMRMATRIVNGEVTREDLKRWVDRYCGPGVWKKASWDADARVDLGEVEKDSPNYYWKIFEKVWIYTPHKKNAVVSSSCKVLFMGKPTTLEGKRAEDIKIIEAKPDPKLKFRHYFNIFSDFDMTPYYTYNSHEIEWRIWDPKKVIPIRILRD